MKTNAPPGLRPYNRRRAAALFGACAFMATVWCHAAVPTLPFEVTLSGSSDYPTITVKNLSHSRPTKFELVMPFPPYVFDYVTIYSQPPEGTVVIDKGDTSNGGSSTQVIELSLSGWDPGESFTIKVDLDVIGDLYSSQDFRNVLLNRGCFAAVSNTESRELLSLVYSGGSRSSYTLAVPRVERLIRLKSLTEAVNGESVGRVTVKIDGKTFDIKGTSGVNVQNVNLYAYDGDTVEVSAPAEVYRNIHGDDISDSAETDPAVIENEAEERFTAIGISVNNVAQTGDPTLYVFDITQDTDVTVKWKHEYALTVLQDFADTQSADMDAERKPWAGPLTSWAAGDPVPSAKKHWIARGETVVAEVDSQVTDFSRPGFDIRYVPRAFRAYGPPNANTSKSDDEQAAEGANHVGASAGDVLTWNEFGLPVGQTEQRQQVRQFTMDGPGGIEYVWQLQFGVRVTVDDTAQKALPRIFKMTATDDVAVGSGEGVYWFDPGTALKVACAADGGTVGSTALKGWVGGDDYYFSSSADIDDSQDGTLLTGGPAPEAGAVWVPSFIYPRNNRKYRGMEIPQLRRATRVMWRFGPPAIADTVTLGEHVFQHAPQYANIFTTEPETVTMVTVSGQNKNVGNSDMARWDPAASRLYPLVPGMFRARWRPSGSSTSVVEVLVTASYPATAHYPHITDTPPVALDPDPNDDFTFKELVYTENAAAIDADNRFTASTPGKSVLLYGVIQDNGRGRPREFLAVRVVDSKAWDTGLRAPRSDVIIGRALEDDELDRAGLGTGYVKFEQARYNPYVYDATKLEGLGAVNVYDMEALRSSAAEKRVVNPAALPGPIIPVNLFPNAAGTQQLVVVWYDDPTENDELLWPYAARVYRPRWPRNESEGLGRIVIASQYGSESVWGDGNEQVVAPAVTSLVSEADGSVTTNVTPAETAYNPSRLQDVTIYVQDDRTKAGYNPNEEHALTAPSLRYADVSPRPPAIYALRDNDLNRCSAGSLTETGQPADYTSHPYVLVQFYDTAVSAYRMRVYYVEREDAFVAGYRFANAAKLVSTTSPRSLLAEPHITMTAGEPVIPFYPLGVVIGAAPPPESFGSNLKSQQVYWEDHKGSSWAVSGGENAWFTFSMFYPMAPTFWWPDAPGVMQSTSLSLPFLGKLPAYKYVKPQVGDNVSFLPSDIDGLLSIPLNTVWLRFYGNAVQAVRDNNPTPVLYKSDWPDVAPILKAGETLTFSGGEYRSDHPLSTTVDDDGELALVETPGLPGVLAFASAEVVFDSLNPLAETAKWKTDWTARIGQVLDVRSVPLAFPDFPAELAPATKRTRVKEGKYVFSELPSSLQKRLLYDPVGGKLLMIGLLNDKDIGDRTLTASPPAVYALEPNIMTGDEYARARALSDDSVWRGAIASLYKLSRNPALIDTNNPDLPDVTSTNYQGELESFWEDYYRTVGDVPVGGTVPLPVSIGDADSAYYVGLEPLVLRDASGTPVTIEDPAVPGLMRTVTDPKRPAPVRAFGPGLALLPNPGFMNPKAELPDWSWVTVVENNDPSLGGSPITLHIVKVDRRERYRGAIKTIESDNVFDENLVLRHTGDFGANADDLYFEWWYRPDDGSLNVPPPDLIAAGRTNPWLLFPDPSGNRGKGRYQITLKGNPNAPEALLADTWWFCRYRHKNDTVEGTDWNVSQSDGSDSVNFTWAGAGNSDPFHDYDADGLPDYRAQLAMGWIKRVLDAVNPYEARIRDFEGDNPATVSSMIQQFGARYEGPVALNPDKNVIENVGLIELYETILHRGRSLSIDLSRPVSTPAIANALELVSTRISDFYTILGNEAYVDALDPTIGFGSDSVEYGSLAPAVFSFQNQLASVLDEELALLRGVDDYYARPVYNRLFWNFTKGEGEAAYAMNYDISDINADGFIDEDDAMILYPQGHGDAWGHYLTALRTQYDLLNHKYFNWVSRSEYYNLQDIVIAVDFLDERKFAQIAAAKAKAGAEIVNLTYRQKYVQDPAAQWQGYTDSLRDRSWGVQGWARRAGQGAYFDWISANALLPSVHPNSTLDGIQRVDRKSNSDIAVVSANLNQIQRTFDEANNGYNPLGLAGDVVPFDITPEKVGDLVFGRTHFEQIYDRAVAALANAVAIWDNANEAKNMLRQVANTEAEYRNAVYQEDLSYRNRLIALFGKPYEGTIGPGKLYPAGYDGPDTLLYMYVDVRAIDSSTVPGPATTFAKFSTNTGHLIDGEIYDAFENGKGGKSISTIDNDVRAMFSPTFAGDTDSYGAPFQAEDGWYSVNYTDVDNLKVKLDRLDELMPVTASGYTYQAPRDWGSRLAVGELQTQINEMLRQEAEVASAIAAWDALTGEIGRTFRLVNARLQTGGTIRKRLVAYQATKFTFDTIIKGLEAIKAASEITKETVIDTVDATKLAIPENLPTAGFSFSPGDALSAARAGIEFPGIVTKTVANTFEKALDIAKLVEQAGLEAFELGVTLDNDRDERALSQKEWLKELEDLVGDEPIKRIEVFKAIEALRQMSERFKAMVDEGTRLIDERAAYNKRVAAQTQRNRYQDMTFRVAHNHALQTYRSAFDLAARYVYLAAKAYDYETNLDPNGAGSPRAIMRDIVQARSVGLFDGEAPRMGKGGLSQALCWLATNYEALKGQLGIGNPQTETGKISLRTELFRILPRGSRQPDLPGFPGGSGDSDTLWRDTLMKARVADLWMVPEFRHFCRTFASDADGPQPAIVLRFGSEIAAGKNFFGRPLSGADHIYDPSHYATKIMSVGVWFSDYQSEDVLNDLPASPRVYLVPIGADIMSVSTADNPADVRLWEVVDQQIPMPLVAVDADLGERNWIPLIDSLNGRMGDPRRFPTFRAYHDGTSVIDEEQMSFDSRLIGRSVWNTQWMLVIPGGMLNADPDVGLDRFIEQVSDIKLVFQTYGYSGN